MDVWIRLTQLGIGQPDDDRLRLVSSPAETHPSFLHRVVEYPMLPLEREEEKVFLPDLFLARWFTIVIFLLSCSLNDKNTVLATFRRMRALKPPRLQKAV